MDMILRIPLGCRMEDVQLGLNVDVSGGMVFASRTQLIGV
jgi:hypothetical protein